MSKEDPLARLGTIAAVILDGRLSELRRCAAARDESLAQIAGLQCVPVPAGDLEGAAAALAALTYQRWADERRRALNQILARQTAEWIDATEAARRAFGRDEALKTLARRADLARRAPDQLS